ncbi:CAP domain-containing protein [Tamlana sp. 2201CG12-4]|uniref:CAP domain-containing protein n=1 Tax=Tamlana sp. 2201CG12-4 TaxID=3112582 RepID=UPI002DB87D23|nr:CAP domain-containing protein [Tamlana sp. 2201CG12-4]MEC3906042.1 CAP domain-containing protein [Tamlana sp. 2201CG12-4]
MKTYALKAWLILLCFTTLICSISCSKDDASEATEKLESLSITEDMLQLVNKHRLNIGKPVLSINSLATQLAEEHTLFMISQKEISHDNFNDRADRLYDEENAYSVAENVAAKQKSAKDVMEAWLNSKGHRENIEGHFTHIGISAIKDANGHYYYTQLFLRQ